ncbi:ABC transporter substrate-binding protein [Nocardioides piscis]|uniref:Amino acid ABC transporter substrate-binding protein n=1 Tax=Nocardioides piscis TaxID=2714938 RepID=A0A6G7YBQ1_9ACTN|nr:ABC transporter substrate-binding protein [Nocardioides piscis]QIK74334.1 amino acid ABC transporter substrate-binding protein [Nocardioides piscis]
MAKRGISTARAAVAGATLLALAACGTQQAAGSSEPDPTLIEDGVLSVCTSLPYEPFEFERDGKLVGFDVDLVNEVAAELDLEAKFVNEKFESIESGEALNEDRCDVAAAALSINGDRARVVDFSSPYFNATQVLVTLKTSQATDLAALAGGRLAVQDGTTGAVYAADHAPANTQIIKFSTKEDVDSAVSGSTVDAGIYDNNIVAEAIKANPGFQVVAEFDTGEQYGMAVKKDGDVDLLRVINNVLADLNESGRYEEILKEWFPESTSTS